ncbi:MaoC/PaaZ C-terminal domain-containing protein [Arthrobacter sp. H20]|uniref:MaoC family dehydratase n=1 Tax=Arthrobacter sp. H20 TaxID=1267981 RepID=UPI00047B406C|nr:MaoC/PaaZ C-terminal domain-containing protein [Arthrobacter sp. H20]
MSEVVLDSVPSLPSLYRSALIGSVPLPRMGRRTKGAGTADLPAVRHSVSGIKASVGELTRFQQLIGAPVHDLLPSGFVHTIAFPVAMSVMARKDFPLPLLGMIHLRNSVEHRRAIHFSEILDVSAWAENLRQHHAGTQVDLVTEVTAQGEVAWIGRSTYLAKGARITGTPTESKEGREPFVAPPLTAIWDLPGSAGRSYAAVSGDYNPIHLNALTAKALGMRRTIAHGMYLASRMVQEGTPAGVESFAWTIDFRSPVLLPARVSIAIEPHDEAGVWHSSIITGWNARKGREHFTGSVTRLPVRPFR